MRHCGTVCRQRMCPRASQTDKKAYVTDLRQHFSSECYSLFSIPQGDFLPRAAMLPFTPQFFFAACHSFRHLMSKPSRPSAAMKLELQSFASLLEGKNETFQVTSPVHKLGLAVMKWQLLTREPTTPQLPCTYVFMKKPSSSKLVRRVSSNTKACIDASPILTSNTRA